MATGFVQRFKGQIKADKLFLGAGGIVDAASGIVGKSDYIQILSLPVTATANTDFTMSIPTGATLVQMAVYTTTAYGAATDATIQLGNVAGGSQYVAPVSIKAIAVVQLALVNAAAAALLSMPAGTPNLFIRVVQSGAASATGAAKLIVDYTV